MEDIVKEERVSETREQLDRMKESINCLKQSISKLASRLTVVLSPFPEKKEEEIKKDINLVPLAQEIQSYISEILLLNEKINNLYERIQL